MSVNTISVQRVCEPLVSGAELVCVHKVDLLLGSASAGTEEAQSSEDRKTRSPPEVDLGLLGNFTEDPQRKQRGLQPKELITGRDNTSSKQVSWGALRTKSR